MSLSERPREWSTSSSAGPKIVARVRAGDRGGVLSSLGLGREDARVRWQGLGWRKRMEDVTAREGEGFYLPSLWYEGIKWSAAYSTGDHDAVSCVFVEGVLWGTGRMIIMGERDGWPFQDGRCTSGGRAK